MKLTEYLTLFGFAMLLMEYKRAFQFKKFLKTQNLDNVVHICYEQIGCAEATVTYLYVNKHKTKHLIVHGGHG